jgi:T-complex protein 1 subunit alpha
LEGIRKRETEIVCEKVKKILDSGVNVILSTKGIDDVCVKMVIEKGGIAVKRCKKEDLAVISKATGGSLVRSLSDLEGNDIIAGTGNAECVSVESIGDSECIFITGCKKKMSSIVLRGGNEQMLEEMERSVHDALCVIKRTLESRMVLPGGGAVECALSLFLEEFASTISSKEYVAVHKFSESLLDVPKILATNAGLDSNEILANLISQQSKGNKVKDPSCFEYGIDVTDGTVSNNVLKGILEPSMIKLKALRCATEAAISILRIDEVIVVKAEKEAKKEICG